MAETCTGNSASCPANGFADPGTACGDATDNECTDRDTCDGAGNCQSNNAPAGSQICGVGACKVTAAECIDGQSVVCTPGNPVTEICDDNVDNDCNGFVDEDCQVCGNETLEGSEQCDDGNTVGGDGCSSTCQIEDADGDGVFDHVDNCPDNPNEQQSDTDGDGVGDACDDDDDGDGVLDGADNCPFNQNADQADLDGDGIGDACDPDDDNDGVGDVDDNCQFLPNPLQADQDADGIGDACDSDVDGDGIENEIDNCPATENPSQYDFDGDGLGGACDDDDDGDEVVDQNDICPETLAFEIVSPENGCSIDQLCPCYGPRGTTTPWKNHGKYVSCVAKSSNSFVEFGLIFEAEKDAMVSVRAQASCGKK